MAGMDLGIDLGTASTLIYIAGRGLAIKEPTVALIDKQNDMMKAAGEEARQMIGRTPGHLVTVQPVKRGVISDPAVAAELMRYFIKQSNGRKLLWKPNVCVSVPMGATETERKVLEEATYHAGARNVTIIECPIAAALGAGIDIKKPCGNMIVDIGGGTADIAVISMGGTVVGTSVKVAGDNFNNEIVRYMKRKHNLLIGETTAEELKRALGCAHPRPELVIRDVRGRNLESALPMSVTVTSDEMLDALKEASMAIVESIRDVLERTSPELAADVHERGIIMTGGGSLLFGLDQLIEEKLKITTVVADDPVNCVAVGAAKYLEIGR